MRHSNVIQELRETTDEKTRGTGFQKRRDSVWGGRSGHLTQVLLVGPKGGSEDGPLGLASRSVVTLARATGWSATETPPGAAGSQENRRRGTEDK